MRYLLRRLLLASVTLILALAPVLSSAHEMSIAEMELRELSHGEFLWQWSATNDKRPDTTDLQPQWPAGCTAESSVLHCGSSGLRGVLSIHGVGERYSAALVKVNWLDGQSRVYTLTRSQPRARLYGAADDKRGDGEIAVAYVVLGVEHIMGGFDHQLFVVGLLFLVGFRRRLLWTITAFTAAHSLTLASAALGWLTLHSAPVEAVIALSIVLVAAEALQQQSTFARRWPAFVAFTFGLVHGLGFAGALKDIGLPPMHLPTALLTFNIGVEVGQLLIVGAAYLVYRMARSRPHFVLARTPAIYLIGSIAASWSIGRIVSTFGFS